MKIQPETLLRSLALSFTAGLITQACAQVKSEKRYEKRLEILRLNNELLTWYINERPSLDHEEQVKMLQEKKEFIEITRNIK